MKCATRLGVIMIRDGKRGGIGMAALVWLREDYSGPKLRAFSSEVRFKL